MIVQYAAAAVFVALAVLARGLLAPVLTDRHPFPTFYVSVIAAAWWGGLRPTLLALVLGYLAADWFFVLPHNEFSALNLANTGTYFFVGLAIAFFTQMMHSAQDRAVASAAEARDRQRELEREIDERQRVEREREHLLEELTTAAGGSKLSCGRCPPGSSLPTRRQVGSSWPMNRCTRSAADGFLETGAIRILTFASFGTRTGARIFPTNGRWRGRSRRARWSRMKRPGFRAAKGDGTRSL